MSSIGLKKEPRGICDTITEKATLLKRGNNFCHLKEGQFGKKKGSCLNSPYLKVNKWIFGTIFEKKSKQEALTEE